MMFNINTQMKLLTNNTEMDTQSSQFVMVIG